MDIYIKIGNIQHNRLVVSEMEKIDVEFYKAHGTARGILTHGRMTRHFYH